MDLWCTYNVISPELSLMYRKCGVTADMLVRVCRLEFSAPFLSHLVQDMILLKTSLDSFSFPHFRTSWCLKVLAHPEFQILVRSKLWNLGEQAPFGRFKLQFFAISWKKNFPYMETLAQPSSPKPNHWLQIIALTRRTAIEDVTCAKCDGKESCE